MRILLAVTSTALFSVPVTVTAAPLRACEQVWDQVKAALRPLLTEPAGSQHDGASIAAEFHTCVSAHNICGVVHDGRYRSEGLVAGDVTDDLPPRSAAGPTASSAVMLVRSIPRVRNDSNQYCLVSSKSRQIAPAQQWAVYGWVITPNASEALPLQRQMLEEAGLAEPASLRGLAAALWFFAQRMSGESPSVASH